MRGSIACTGRSLSSAIVGIQQGANTVKWKELVGPEESVHSIVALRRRGCTMRKVQAAVFCLLAYRGVGVVRVRPMPEVRKNERTKLV